MSSCATCAQSYTSPTIAEKPPLPGRTLPCCQRSICIRCLNTNKRYEEYCPYCQISTAPSALPQGLKDPPAYATFEQKQRLRDLNNASNDTAANQTSDDDDELPPYSANNYTQQSPVDSKTDPPAEDVLHFVHPSDSMLSLSLAYGVPIDALRRANNVYADHLLQARKTVLVPGEFYKGGVSLSPRPVEGEEEEGRRVKVRRWMVACKVAEYDVATLYLEQAEWDLDAAVEAYREDERWEKEHPMQAKERAGKKGKDAKSSGMRRFVGSSGSASRS